MAKKMLCSKKSKEPGKPGSVKKGIVGLEAGEAEHRQGLRKYARMAGLWPKGGGMLWRV